MSCIPLCPLHFPLSLTGSTVTTEGVGAIKRKSYDSVLVTWNSEEGTGLSPELSIHEVEAPPGFPWCTGNLRGGLSFPTQPYNITGKYMGENFFLPITCCSLLDDSQTEFSHSHMGWSPYSTQ